VPFAQELGGEGAMNELKPIAGDDTRLAGGNIPLLGPRR